ncbi:MAG: hypothetical protein II839_06305 [Kiritimatiellae bacterium]|nr:hypothetical protein [Kiritimatiellia bacterium]
MKRPLRHLALLTLAAAPGVAAAAAGGEPAQQPTSPFAPLVTLACFALLVWDVATFPRRIYRGADLARDSKRLCAAGVAGFALIALQVVLFAVLSPIPPFSVHGGAPVTCRLRPDLPAALVFCLCLFARTPVRVPFGEETGTQVADVSSDAAPRRSGGFAAVACRLFEWGAAFTLMGAFAVSDMRRAVEPGLDWTQCFLVFVLPMLVQAVCLFGMSAAGIAALRLRVAVDGRPLAPAAKFAKGCGNIAIFAALFFGLEALRAALDNPEPRAAGLFAPLIRIAFAAWLAVRFRRLARTPEPPAPPAALDTISKNNQNPTP